MFDSTTMSLELPLEKRDRILALLQKFGNLDHCTIRDFAHFVGVLTAACPAVAYGWLYQKSFEKVKFLSLLVNGNDFDSLMYLPQWLQDDFHWWENHIMSAVNPIRHGCYQRVIYSDASTSGWGTAFEGNVTRGFWNSKERDCHINYLELLAAFFALKCFATDISDCEVLLRIDNATTLAYINRMGGIRFSNLHAVAKDIWQWCEARRIWIRASYIPSRENTEADR